MPIDKFNLSQCYGCGACEHVCPTNAISLTNNSQGFIYPKFYQEKCIDCGRCESVCSISSEVKIAHEIKAAFVLQSNSDSIRVESTSGGAFTTISDVFLNSGGCVCGSVFDKKLGAKHILTCESTIRDKMRGSKYIQSDISSVYVEISKNLKAGKKVLFVGTPCQVAGVRKAIPESVHSNLFTVDLLCHGVMSPLIFREHLYFIEKWNNGIISDYSFRNKTFGARSYTHMVVFEDGRKSTSIKLLYLRNMYNRLLGYRNSCYHCKFACSKRMGDISLGDYWDSNGRNVYDDNKGTSLVLINSEKGKAVFDVLNGCKVDCISLKNIDKSALREHIKEPFQSNIFWNDFFQNGYSYVKDKYAKHSFKEIKSIYINRLAATLKCDDILLKIKRRIVR